MAAKKDMNRKGAHSLPVKIQSVRVAGLGEYVVGSMSGIKEIVPVPLLKGENPMWVATDGDRHPLFTIDSGGAPCEVGFFVPVKAEKKPDKTVGTRNPHKGKGPKAPKA